MSDPLATYLHDHLAGADYGIQMLEKLQEHHPGQPIGDLATALLPDLRQDRAILQHIIERVGSSGSAVKELGGWLSGKVSRLILGSDRGVGLGAMESLEILSLGTYGKLNLWRALQTVAPEDSRLQGLDFASLCERAQQQHDRVEQQRLLVARTALRPT